MDMMLLGAIILTVAAVAYGFGQRKAERRVLVKVKAAKPETRG